MTETAMTENVQIETRLRQLRDEYEKGQAMLAQLDQQRNDLREQLLRISGAIQVLEELARGEPPAEPPAADPAPDHEPSSPGDAVALAGRPDGP